jgi:hypothetical protein
MNYRFVASNMTDSIADKRSCGMGDWRLVQMVFVHHMVLAIQVKSLYFPRPSE